MLPALQAFCLWCAIGVFAVWVLQITLFTAALSLDARRRDAGLLDCCCCFRPCSDSCVGEEPVVTDDLLRPGRWTERTLSFYFAKRVTSGVIRVSCLCCIFIQFVVLKKRSTFIFHSLSLLSFASSFLCLVFMVLCNWNRR